MVQFQCSILHMHKCMYFFLSASRILHPTCTSACKVLIVCFMKLINVHITMMRSNISFHISHQYYLSLLIAIEIQSDCICLQNVAAGALYFQPLSN